MTNNNTFKTLLLCTALGLAACDTDDGTTDGMTTAATDSTTGATDGTTDGTTGGTTGGTTDGTTTGQAALEIIGEYMDGFGGSQTITAQSWDDGFGVYNIVTYDNDADTLIAQNDAANEFNPELYSRFDWAQVDDRLFYCQVAYDKATAEDAAAEADPDRTDPTTDGCGGFPWSELIAN